MAHAGRPHAGVGEPVVEPRRGAIAEVRAERPVDGRQHLQQHERRPGQRERAGQRRAALHRADQHAHGDGEGDRQHAAQHERPSTTGGQRRDRPGQAP